MDRISDGKLFEMIKLKNGLALQMFYKSTHTAGDRYRVTFEARINVEVLPDYFTYADLSDFSFEDVRAILGNKTTYSYQKERNFIAEGQKTSVLETMKTDFLGTNLDYLSSKQFPYRLIKKNYLDALKKRELMERQQYAK